MIKYVVIKIPKNPAHFLIGKSHDLQYKTNILGR